LLLYKRRELLFSHRQTLSLSVMMKRMVLVIFRLRSRNRQGNNNTQGQEKMD
jgi:hypothetical protein